MGEDLQKGAVGRGGRRLGGGPHRPVGLLGHRGGGGGGGGRREGGGGTWGEARQSIRGGGGSATEDGAATIVIKGRLRGRPLAIAGAATPMGAKWVLVEIRRRTTTERRAAVAAMSEEDEEEEDEGFREGVGAAKQPRLSGRDHRPHRHPPLAAAAARQSNEDSERRVLRWRFDLTQCAPDGVHVSHCFAVDMCKDVLLRHCSCRLRLTDVHGTIVGEVTDFPIIAAD
eukprot:GHVU01129312.1.p1 GENE.GHVU01129312.1~~GHVU01129312.1.p1  ORF type:complete len:228 (+),score=49.59 GHVU01129312.1:72-755(+)